MDRTLLFLCTGNYYRSRFAELYFRHLAAERGLDWQADSRGLRLSSSNVGPISQYTIEECEKLGVCAEPLRAPRALREVDLVAAHRIIAVKETEHRVLIREHFPAYEERIEFWEVHDVDCAPPHEALPQLRRHVEDLVERVLSDVTSSDDSR